MSKTRYWKLKWSEDRILFSVKKIEALSKQDFNDFYYHYSHSFTCHNAELNI